MGEKNVIVKQEEMDLQAELYQKLQTACMPNIGKKPAKSLVSLMYPGITIKKDNYVHKGEYKDEMFGLVDPVLDIDIIYSETSKKLSGVYRSILEKNTPQPDPGYKQTPEEKEVDIYLKDNGKEYRNYEKKYNKLREKYETGHSKSVKREMTALLKEWEAEGKSEYEKKLQEKLNSGGQGRYRNIMKALDVLGDCEYNGNVYECSFLPGQWVDENSDLSWVEVKIDKETMKQGSSMRMQEIARVEKQFGIQKDTRNIFARWFAPREPQRVENGNTEIREMTNRVAESCDFSSMEISFEVARVQVQRRWFDGALFLELLEQQEKGKKERIGFIEGIMVARNIYMRMEVSREAAEQLKLQKDKAENGSMSCGPFSVDFKENLYINETEMKSEKDRVFIEIKTGNVRQIIGYINTVLESGAEA